MTISSTSNRISYAGDDSTTAFSFPYLFFADDDLKVILVVDATGVETTQTLTTHYTVAGAGVAAGGTVTMVTEPASGETLVIIRQEQFTQGLDLVENDPFPSESVEQQFDILTMLAQQTDDEIKRAMRLSDGDTSGLDTTMPTPAANEFLRFDAAGTALTSAGLADLGTIAVPGSSTDNAVVRFNGTGGATLQNSVVLIGDAGVVTGVDTINGNDADTLLVDADIGAAVQAFDAGISSTPHTQGLHTIYVPAGAMRPTSSNGCASVTVVETTAGRPDLQVMDFDASADEHAQFQVCFPKSWDEGTVTFRAFWTSTATDTDGVSWGLQGVSCSDGDTADVAYGTAVVVDDLNQSTAEDVYVTDISGDVTIDGTPAAADVTFFRVFRDVSDANDTATEDARLIGIQIFFTTDAGNDA